MSEEPTDHEDSIAYDRSLLGGYLARAYDAHMKPVFDASLEREVADAVPRSVIETKLKALQAVMVRDYVSRVHHGFLRRVLALTQHTEPK